jgi:hypothetical protein
MVYAYVRDPSELLRRERVMVQGFGADDYEEEVEEYYSHKCGRN